MMKNYGFSKKRKGELWGLKLHAHTVKIMCFIEYTSTTAETVCNNTSGYKPYENHQCMQQYKDRAGV